MKKVILLGYKLLFSELIKLANKNKIKYFL